MLTVKSAGFNWRLPKAITLFLCTLGSYFEVEVGLIKTCQAIVFGVAIVLNEIEEINNCNVLMPSSNNKIIALIFPLPTVFGDQRQIVHRSSGRRLLSVKHSKTQSARSLMPCKCQQDVKHA